ncbi:MAG: hypothetical protein AB7O78_02385 [Thermoleophilia bacterium]
MTADPHRDLSPIDDPQSLLVARGLPAFGDVPAGAAGPGERRPPEPPAWTARVPGVADRRGPGWSPFPLDAIEID